MLVLGAAEKPERYSCKAVKSLYKRGYEPVAVGFKPGFIRETEILTGKPEIEDVDTVLLYLGKNKQMEYADYVVSLNPRRVIFNPGTENPELQEMLKEKGIEVVKDCALVMLSTNTF